MYYSDTLLIQRVKQLHDFKEIPKGYWIIGVRSSDDKPNSFDDTFHLMLGEKLIMSTTGTTNPGTPILQGGFKKYNSDGAAVVEADRIYYGVWMYGKHQGKIPALKQVGAPITIYRDGDGDNKSEEIGKCTTGYYGINFHPDQYDINGIDKASDTVGLWSAGCQVCNNIEDYRRIISLTKDQESVTFCLLKEFSV